MTCLPSNQMDDMLSLSLLENTPTQWCEACVVSARKHIQAARPVDTLIHSFHTRCSHELDTHSSSTYPNDHAGHHVSRCASNRREDTFRPPIDIRDAPVAGELGSHQLAILVAQHAWPTHTQVNQSQSKHTINTAKPSQAHVHKYDRYPVEKNESMCEWMLG